MHRRTFVATAAAAPFAAPAGLRAQAQAQATAPRIAFLGAFLRADVDFVLGQIRAELEKLGWTDRRNIVLLEPRTAEGRNELLPSMAAEIVAQGPDLVLTQSLPATRALMQATKSIPIVMYGVGNPVELGIVTDYRKPGGNVTGSSYMLWRGEEAVQTQLADRTALRALLVDRFGFDLPEANRLRVLAIPEWT